MIQLLDVHKYYRTRGHTKVVLDHVTALFERGHSYGILGVNGAGKSTMLRLIAGTEMPNSGKVKREVRVSWPLGFATAFNAQMTGRNNVTFAARAVLVDGRLMIFGNIDQAVDIYNRLNR